MKKSKRVTAGVLAFMMAFGFPADMRRVEAVTPSVNMAESGYERVWIPEAPKEIPVEIPEKIIISEPEPVTPEQDTEDISEGEISDNDTSNNDTSNNVTSGDNTTDEETSDNDTSVENASDEETAVQETTDEGTTEEISEDETADEETSENTCDDESEPENDTEISAAKTNANIQAFITDYGILDYRTYYNSSKSIPQMKIEIEPSDDKTNDEKENLKYRIDISGTDVICPIPTEDTSEDSIKYFRNSNKCRYITTKDTILFEVKGVGIAHITINVSGSKTYQIIKKTTDILVTDSALYDEDFFIELVQSQNNQEKKIFSYNEWLDYLESHDNWVNGNIYIGLTDTGKKYYKYISSHLSTANSGADGIKRYGFWAENTETRAVTKNAKNGTRNFEAGIDTSAPAIDGLVTDSQCYKPTMTMTEQYYAQDFVLKGSFTDADSGISKIEYTTDFNYSDIENTKWIQLPINTPSDEINAKQDFELVLGDGCYSAIAVRAYDVAGNVSNISGFVNEEGDFIKVIVDRSEPVIKVDMTSKGAPYSGDNENWTNQDVVFNINLDKSSCPYAGLYQYEYTYEKIGENPGEGQRTAVDIGDNSSDTLVIKDDKNGYYHFQAVSKSGVRTKEDMAGRVLLQHEIADIKPVIETSADNTKKKNGWYNKESKTPVISFEYPEYDSGEESKRYDAPIELHYTLTNQNEDIVEKKAAIGVIGSSEGDREFNLVKDNLEDLSIDFGDDGIYTLEYWITDAAGNASERQQYLYKIDCHEPENLRVSVADMDMPIDSGGLIVYDRFYKEAVSASATADYGISGKDYIKVLKARKIGQWNNKSDDGFEDAESFSVAPDTRCFLYIKAQDNAGNVTEGWTKGIVVDNMAPIGEKGKELIVEPVGANKNGFFNDDVKVQISIKDQPGQENCAALMTVKGSIGRDGQDTISGSELFSFTKENPTDDELNAASAFDTVQIIDAKANESNEAYIEVTATDRSDNTAVSTKLLKIDVTAPEVEVDFDNNNAINGSFYNQNRTATIHVNELNFDENAVKVDITRNGTLADVPISGWKNDKTHHYATVTFSEDGDYTMEVSCTDLADNESEKVSVDSFTIDKTLPVVELELNNDRMSGDKEYFPSQVTADITVTEHNFDENDFLFVTVPAAKPGSWTHSGDKHFMSVTFSEDGDYNISCSYTDKAGNAADDSRLSKEFTIDKTAPVITIEGVADGSSNAGEVTPVITVLDLNMEPEDVTVKVTTGLGKTVGNAIDTAAINETGKSGYSFTLSDMTYKEDNIYFMSVNVSDKAGNNASQDIKFSLNRKGSTYDLTQLIALVDRQYISYRQLEDIQITEMNIDKVSEFDIYISKNGDVAKKAKYYKNVSGSEKTGYVYTYTVSRKYFTQEGNYRISLYSKDKAGNEVNSFDSIIGSEIVFAIDNTPPKVVIDGVEWDKLYAAEGNRAGIVISDNSNLSEAEIMLVNDDNEIIESWDYMELSKAGETLYIDIPKDSGNLSLIYRVKDFAGNEIQIAKDEKTPLENLMIAKEKMVYYIQNPEKQPDKMRAAAVLIPLALLAAIIVLSGKRINSRNRKI